MTRTDRAWRAGVVILAAAVGVIGASSGAAAQIRRQGVQAAQPAAQTPPPRRAAPLPVYPSGSGMRIGYAGERNQGAFQAQGQFRQHRLQQRFVPPVVYYPVPSYGYGSSYGYGYGYAPTGCGASVCDVNGNPVMRGFDEPGQNQMLSRATVPDLSGSPYVALEGGVIFVDFGNGDRRNVIACAQQAAAATPDGQPRTIFYTPQADGLILRAGSRGRVIGTPPAGALMCYGLDQYGRVALAY
ncbi:MAG: hypothetical protein M3Z10_02045 [Gemmatimonadota bacterium]|nr:hypothetical protein [Gemmatimonadota bacterium]